MTNLLSDILVAFVSAALTLLITNDKCSVYQVNLFLTFLEKFFDVINIYVFVYYIMMGLTDFLNKKSNLNSLEETVDWYISMYENN